MGRGVAPGIAKAAGTRPDIAGWGAFTSSLTVVGLFVGGVSWTAALGGGTFAAVAFTAAWIAGRGNRTA